MDRVEELEAAIDDLSPEDFRRIASWLRERDQSLWDRQMDDDSSGGKLDFLFEEANGDAKEDIQLSWPGL